MKREEKELKEKLEHHQLTIPADLQQAEATEMEIYPRPGGIRIFSEYSIPELGPTTEDLDALMQEAQKTLLIEDVNSKS